jgi:hypothetical protein
LPSSLIASSKLNLLISFFCFFSAIFLTFTLPLVFALFTFLSLYFQSNFLLQAL